MTPLLLLEPSIWPDVLESPPPIQVHPGEFVLMTGPPGCGTSRSLLALAGRTADGLQGAYLEGLCPGELTHRQRRELLQRLRLAHVPHEPVLQSNLSVMENLLLTSRFLGERGESEAVREALVLLGAAGLSWSASLLPSRLTPEARKAVALIRAFLRNPRVALLDEPLSGLDEGSMAAGRSIVRALARSGACAILAATREPERFRGIPHRRVDLRPAAGHAGSGKEPAP